jgi:Mn-dependent DtxR family transcriptional regulator
LLQGAWKRYEQNELTHSAAHHLMAVHELRARHGYARVSDVAQHLQITKGSVSSAMKHLKERGYVREDHNRFLELTESGMRVVEEVEAARWVFQRFLADALGMAEEDARIDACKVEHLVGAEARARLLSFLRLLLSDEPAARDLLHSFRRRAAAESGAADDLACLAPAGSDRP